MCACIRNLEDGSMNETMDNQANDGTALPDDNGTPTPAPRRLVRLPKPDAEIAGVAAGLAHYLGVSVGVVRVGFVIGTCLGGAGLAAYIAAAFLLPRPDDTDSLGQRLSGGRSDVLLGIIGALTLGLVGLFGDYSWDLGMIGLLAAAGVVLWVRSSSSTRSTSWAPPSVYTPGVANVVSARPSGSSEARWRKLRYACVGVAVAVVGGLIAAPFSNVTNVLVVAGGILLVGLAVGVVRGYGWTLALPALLTAGLLLPASFYDHAGVSLRAGAGEVSATAQQVAAGRRTFRYSAGSINLDLRGLQQSETLNVAVGAGEIIIVVPDGVSVEVAARAGAGEIRLFNEVVAGTYISSSYGGPAEAAPLKLTLNVRVGMGQIIVSRATGSGVLK